MPGDRRTALIVTADVAQVQQHPRPAACSHRAYHPHLHAAVRCRPQLALTSRARQILQALVVNCGTSFQATFANERLVDRIKLMVGDPMIEPRVKRKIMSVLASWHRQFKDDARMQLVAGLYVSCGGGKKVSLSSRVLLRRD